MNKLLAWFKKLKQIVANYDADKANHVRWISEVEGLIRERTKTGIDVHFKSGSHVIVLGRYKGVDFVNSYVLRDHEFHEIVDHVKHLERTSQTKFIDTIPEFEAVFKKELEW